MPLAPLTDEDKARLRAEWEKALHLLATRAPAIAVALFANRAAAGAMLLSLAKEIGQCFADRENAKLALRELQATGAVTAVQAWFVGWLIALPEGAAPHIDPEDPTTWGLGAPPLLSVGTPDRSGAVSLDQAPQDAGTGQP